MKNYRISSVWWEEPKDKPSYLFCRPGITVISDVTRERWGEKLINVLELYFKTIALIPEDIMFREPWSHQFIKPPLGDATVKSAHVHLVSDMDRAYIDWECQLVGMRGVCLRMESSCENAKVVSDYLYGIEALDVSTLRVSELINDSDSNKIIVLKDTCCSFDEHKYCNLFPAIKDHGIKSQVLILTNNPSACNSWYEALDRYLHSEGASQKVSLKRLCKDNVEGQAAI